MIVQHALLQNRHSQLLRPTGSWQWSLQSAACEVQADMQPLSTCSSVPRRCGARCLSLSYIENLTLALREEGKFNTTPKVAVYGS